ncbi:MAG: tRNA (adenine(22)-N(1))-methyltransferase TrmK [Clostridia bacterium]|nr:tRNA (adenine(22)-N(1))-methyltransferase TrmK [Clostridia bacterium]
MSPTPPILTPRLQQIANTITPCACMADIGTDHAYLPVYLCMTGVCKRGIASDIRRGPLQRAKDTLRRYGMESRIETRLGGGVDTLAPGEADCIVIAGMGGLMIAEILKANPTVFAKSGQILLQPMTAVPELRSFLWENGYTVVSETLAKEEQKLYHILAVEVGQEPTPPTPTELYLGQRLLTDRPEHFAEYLQKQRRKLTRMAEGLKQSQSEDTALRLKETLALLDAIEALEKEEHSC